MVILLLIWAAVVGSIYSNFLVFYSNFSESTNYHKAYYAAISALERAELVTKQRAPWYEWNGWRKHDWRNGNTNSDNLINNFSYLSNDSSVFRDINSRTTRIPTEWEWDVEFLLKADDSSGYNMMDYENAQIFLLYYDEWWWNAYKKTSCTDNDWTRNNHNCKKSNTNKIEWYIRLPKKLYSTDWGFNFWNLDTSKSLVEGYAYSNKDDVIVDWQIRWKYSNEPFTIYSSQNDANSLDSSIRESDINDTLHFIFYDKKSPIYKTNGQLKKGNNITKLTVVGKKSTNIEDNAFNRTFNNNNSSLLQLRFSLLNLLKTNTQLYPFLEYYADFGNTVSDKYYTINTEWYYGGYKVNKKVLKPTVKESVLSSFTSIFK